MWGLQFHPEVTHSPRGKDILKNFVVNIAKAKQDWVMTDYANEFIEEVRAKVGPTGHVIGAVSGGVDFNCCGCINDKGNWRSISCHIGR